MRQINDIKIPSALKVKPCAILLLGSIAARLGPVGVGIVVVVIAIIVGRRWRSAIIEIIGIRGRCGSVGLSPTRSETANRN